MTFLTYCGDPSVQSVGQIGSPVCPYFCWNVHLIPASGDDEVYHMPVSRAGMRPGGIVFILVFEHGVGYYHIELSAYCQ